MINGWNIISEVSDVEGVPSWIPLTIAGVESSWNPNLDIVDTNGQHSTGLFQLNQGGLGSGHSIQSLKNPDVNAQIAIKAMKPWYTQGYNNGLRGEALLDYVANNAGWPGQMGVDWTKQHTGYDNLLHQKLNQVAPNFKDATGTPPGDANFLQKSDVATATGNWTSLLNTKPVYTFLIIVVGVLLISVLLYRTVTK